MKEFVTVVTNTMDERPQNKSNKEFKNNSEKLESQRFVAFFHSVNTKPHFHFWRKKPVDLTSEIFSTYTGVPTANIGVNSKKQPSFYFSHPPYFSVLFSSSSSQYKLQKGSGWDLECTVNFTGL